MRLASPLVLLLLLSACVHTEWRKEGATIGDLEQVKASCSIEGRWKAPPIMVREERPWMKVKEKGGIACGPYGCFQQPVRHVPYGEWSDMNQDLRDQVVKACFYRNGWQEVSVE